MATAQPNKPGQSSLTSFYKVVIDNSDEAVARRKRIQEMWDAENRRVEEEARKDEEREIKEIAAEAERWCLYSIAVAKLI